jgi:hypothetical protein
MALRKVVSDMASVRRVQGSITNMDKQKCLKIYHYGSLGLACASLAYESYKIGKYSDYQSVSIIPSMIYLPYINLLTLTRYIGILCSPKI